jgi:hypothetical protein
MDGLFLLTQGAGTLASFLSYLAVKKDAQVVGPFVSVQILGKQKA